jgi:hypothetical protein
MNGAGEKKKNVIDSPSLIFPVIPSTSTTKSYNSLGTRNINLSSLSNVTQSYLGDLLDITRATKSLHSVLEMPTILHTMY